jgi:hypothetical protein
VIYPRELENQLFVWALLAGGAIFLLRYLVLELIGMIGACVLRLIELYTMIRLKRATRGRGSLRPSIAMDEIRRRSVINSRHEPS